MEHAGNFEARSPHPTPLPMGEGVPSRPLFGRSLSHGERDRVRGSAPGSLRYPLSYAPTGGYFPATSEQPPSLMGRKAFSAGVVEISL